MADITRLKCRRRQLSVSHIGVEGVVKEWQGGVGCRCGKIQGWTEGMARRLGAYLDNFREDFKVMVTLTYPGVYPGNGREVKAHLRIWTERLRRDGWLVDGSFVWFLEFQARGAPHYHLLCTKWIGKNWVAGHWAAVTGGDQKSCSRVEALRHPLSAGAYARKYARKSDQKVVPEGFSDVGRMWGCCGARKNSDGVLRVPVVVADIATASTGWLQRVVEDYPVKVRLVETQCGFVCYGEESEVRALWRYLQDVIKSVVPRENPLGGSPREMSGGSRVMRGNPERVQRTSWQQWANA